MTDVNQAGSQIIECTEDKINELEEASMNRNICNL
jgi:hypothetical protein